MIPDDLLARSLEEIRQGKGSLEAILTRFPDATRVELEPLLRLALQVERLRDDTVAAPSSTFRASLRSQLMSASVETAPAIYRNGHTPHAPELALVPPAAPAKIIPLSAPRTSWGRRWQQLAASFAAGIVMLAGAGVGGVQAAKDSLPDQPFLYNLKLAQENVRLSLAADGDERVGLYLQIAGTRLQELSRATDAGKTELAYHLSQKYSQTLNQATSSIQNQGPEKNAISNTEVAGLVGQQVTSLEDLQKKAPNAVQGPVALALSAAKVVQSDLAAPASAAPSQPSATPVAGPTNTAVVSDPPPPMPSATIAVPEPTVITVPDITINNGEASPTGSIPNQEKGLPLPPAGGLLPPSEKDGPSSATPPERGLSGSVPAPQPIPPRAGETPSLPGPVTAQPGGEAPVPVETPTPTATPTQTPSDGGSLPAGPAVPTPLAGDKPPVISVPPDGGTGTPTSTPDDGKGSGDLPPAPSPTPSKGLTTPDGGGSKDRVLPSLRPSFEAEVADHPKPGASIQITGALVAPDDGRGIR